jgi:hypothetical protein
MAVSALKSIDATGIAVPASSSAPPAKVVGKPAAAKIKKMMMHRNKNAVNILDWMICRSSWMLLLLVSVEESKRSVNGE